MMASMGRFDLIRKGALLSVIFCFPVAFPHFLDDFLKTLDLGDSLHDEAL
jgi:hypothetical protein